MNIHFPQTATAYPNTVFIAFTTSTITGEVTRLRTVNRSAASHMNFFGCTSDFHALCFQLLTVYNKF